MQVQRTQQSIILYQTGASKAKEPIPLSSRYDLFHFIRHATHRYSLFLVPLSLLGSGRTTYNHHTTFYVGAALFQGTHIASLSLLARACTYGIPLLSKNMHIPVKSL